MNTEIKDLLNRLYDSEKQLSSGQFEFLESVKKQFYKNKSLSEKQITVLKDILKNIPSEQRFSNKIRRKKYSLKN